MRRCVLGWVPAILLGLSACAAVEAATLGAAELAPMVEEPPPLGVAPLEEAVTGAPRSLSLGEPTGTGSVVPEPQMLLGSLVAFAGGGLVLVRRTFR